MGDGGQSADDSALLARLNALRKSNIGLDTKLHEPSPQRSPVVDPAPARALHADLVSGLKTLNGEAGRGSGELANASGGNASDIVSEDEGKTIEELLAEIGPEGSWAVPKDEAGQIDDLLRSARSTLQTSMENETDAHQQETDGQQGKDSAVHSAIPSGAQPEPTEEELDREADEYLTSVLDELRNAPYDDPVGETHDKEHVDKQSSSANAFPATPAKGPEPPSYSEATADDELASRFASLGLPSVPTSMKTTTTKAPVKEQPKGYTDEDIDSWCTICNEDASLSCIGCGGDLYCTKCWLEGHKGPDAGYDERTHKAVQYNKGGGMKKQPTRRMMGA